MKQLSSLPILCLSFIFLISCSTPQYFHDTASAKRQKELRDSRSANIVGDILIGISTACMSAALETEIEFIPTEQQFKKLNLVNPTPDTIYVNMLSDVVWDKENYCDFMDLRIPPFKTCKVMVPINANYNLYFSTTPNEDDDEMMEIYTTSTKRILLKPGTTILSETEEE